MLNHQAYLEAPIQRHYVESDTFHDFCERFDLDPSSEQAERAWGDYVLDGDYPAPLAVRERDDYLDNLPEPPE